MSEDRLRRPYLQMTELSEIRDQETTVRIHARRRGRKNAGCEFSLVAEAVAQGNHRFFHIVIEENG